MSSFLSFWDLHTSCNICVLCYNFFIFYYFISCFYYMYCINLAAAAFLLVHGNKNPCVHFLKNIWQHWSPVVEMCLHTVIIIKHFFYLGEKCSACKMKDSTMLYECHNVNLRLYDCIRLNEDLLSHWVKGFCRELMCFLSLWASEHSNTEQSLIQQRRRSPDPHDFVPV